MTNSGSSLLKHTDRRRGGFRSPLGDFPGVINFHVRWGYTCPDCCLARRMGTRPQINTERVPGVIGNYADSPRVLGVRRVYNFLAQSTFLNAYDFSSPRQGVRTAQRNG